MNGVQLFFPLKFLQEKIIKYSSAEATSKEMAYQTNIVPREATSKCKNRLSHETIYHLTCLLKIEKSFPNLQ